MNQAKFNHPPIPTDKDEAQKELAALLLEEQELISQLNEGGLDNKIEEHRVIQNAEEEVTPVTADEFMKQLATQMEMMLEIDKKIAEIKKENMELEKFIIEQEELEKGKILKEEAVKVIKQAKKAKLKRDDPKLAIFDKEWIDEVYGKEK